MTRYQALLLVVAPTVIAATMKTPCLGHGMPIHVNVVAGKLAVSNGLTDDRGFADWVFADPDDEEAIFSPVAGNRLRVSLPGFDITDVPGASQLSVEAISRPDFTNPAAPQRWLWYVNPISGLVSNLSAALRLDANSSQGFTPNISMGQSAAPVNSTVKIADLPDHAQEHHLVNFLLNDQSAPIGAYGFFARMTSPDLTSSDPLLISLNHGLDAATFQAAAKRINAAARLPGDYDGDEDADGSDLLAWQRTLSSTTVLAADGSLNNLVDAADLAVWRDNFGRISPAAVAVVSAIPEPHSLALAILAAGLFATMRSRTPPPVRTGCRG